RVLIYGSGDAGAELAASLRSRPNGRFPVAFVDDDPKKQGKLVHGVPVLGNGESLDRLVKTLLIDEIIVAIPSANSEQMRRIIFRCEELECRLGTLPSISEILAGQRQDRVRNIRAEDLLEREPAKVDMVLLSELLSGERVLVTGAGGSIGSELCRQIISFHPSELIIVGHGENSVFEIAQELRDDFGFKAKAIIADIQDRSRLDRVFREHKPTIIFHAAAHKHVPLMEDNPEEAIKNNVLGTLN
ncbi:MAG: SDR family NAD(P)-dependent oxidoreductase, partial [Armatimonadota bacterium]|nr:SDR family NAD(P)-dependent oxidoreductase [Armatimonadota bacterium]